MTGTRNGNMKNYTIKKGHRDDNKMKLTMTILLGVVVLFAIAATIVIALNSGEKLADCDESMDVCLDEIHGKLGNTTDIDEVTTIYQKYINRTELANRAELYRDEGSFIMGFDLDKEYGEIVVNDYEVADEIDQTADSAGQVANVAIDYGFEEVTSKYMALWRERMLADGINLEEIVE